MRDHTTAIARLRELADHVQRMPHVRMLTEANRQQPPEGATPPTRAYAPWEIPGFNMAFFAADTADCGTVGCLAGIASARWLDPAAEDGHWGLSTGMEALGLYINDETDAVYASALFSPTLTTLEPLTPQRAAVACQRLADLLRLVDMSGRPWRAHTDAETLTELLWSGEPQTLY